MSTSVRFEMINEESRIHLNLSANAEEVITRDRFNFAGNDSFSGFINRVIRAFRTQADASIAIATQRKRRELEAILRKALPYQEERSAIIDVLLAQYIKELQKKISSYVKGSACKFRLDDKNREVLEDDPYGEGAYYKGSIGKYIKALIEEYAEKSSLERERIIFKDYFDTIEKAITSNSYLAVKVDSGFSFFIRPVGVRADSENMYYYLIGYSSPLGGSEDERIASFRLSRLRRVEKAGSCSAITTEERKKLNEEIRKRRVQFLVGAPEVIKVRLTEKGQLSYQKQTHLRPRIVSVEKDIFCFDCTAMQAESYFFKFGVDAEILEPEFLRKRFMENYVAAANLYSH